MSQQPETSANIEEFHLVSKLSVSWTGGEVAAAAGGHFLNCFC